MSIRLVHHRIVFASLIDR